MVVVELGIGIGGEGGVTVVFVVVIILLIVVIVGVLLVVILVGVIVLIGVVAVSYTHLDVYKRQILNFLTGQSYITKTHTRRVNYDTKVIK